MYGLLYLIFQGLQYLILPQKIENEIKPLFRINLHSSEATFKNQHSKIIIHVWSIPKLEYSMIPKIYFIKILLKDTANRCKQS